MLKHNIKMQLNMQKVIAFIIILRILIGQTKEEIVQILFRNVYMQVGKVW